jgi:D-sedoheptulose 7-phosphate isomerase
MVADWVESMGGGKAIVMLGFDGGELRKICNLSIIVTSKPSEYGPVEDMYLMINHLLVHWFHKTS